MKKIFLIVIAVVIFLLAVSLLRPAPSANVVVAAADMKVGHVISDQDVQIQAMPTNIVPPDAILVSADAVGQPLRIDRGQGDILRMSQLGSVAKLEPNERAIAIKITDASGLAGLLYPGQLVGVIAIVPSTTVDADGKTHTGSFAKASIEGLRVLYVDPLWSASKSQPSIAPKGTPQANALSGGVQTNERAKDGSIILAVPTDLQTILYDFSETTGSASETRKVNALELLAALGLTDGAKLSLYLLPTGEAAPFTSPGLLVPDLAVLPKPTATPTATPEGGAPLP
jgi:pilus assembly protein CpaB